MFFFKKRNKVTILVFENALLGMWKKSHTYIRTTKNSKTEALSQSLGWSLTLTNGTKYSKMDYAKFVEDSL